MGLDELREEIRKKDEEIVRLIAERTAIAVKVGEEKKRNGFQIRDAKVEESVKARYVAMGSAQGMSEEVMDRVASALIKEAVDAECRVPGTKRAGKAAVIGGAGKMGSWTASLLKESGFDVCVVDPSVDNGFTVKDCAGCDLVVVSVPIDATGKVLDELEQTCRPETLIFDLSSLKSPIAPKLRKMARSMKVCSVHPMFGPSATSMYGRNLIVCDCGNRQAVDEAVSLFDDKGGNIRVMGLSEHDSYMSYVLGLTHAVNIALFTVLERSGYSFEDLRSVSSTTFNK
ncbi:MAG: prephenate dehydrogenase/arogenate dehydrogenase family protein, partial [Candidatus Methanomethylophilaceae archaeon]|nr:prephenate dehydrogenase/arogenate dehydrogenase family protein [Candidatus Methanomethylophilaceae archaeon]